MLKLRVLGEQGLDRTQWPLPRMSDCTDPCQVVPWWWGDVLCLRHSAKNVLLLRCRGKNRSGQEPFGCHRARCKVSVWACAWSFQAAFSMHTSSISIATFDAITRSPSRFLDGPRTCVMTAHLREPLREHSREVFRIVESLKDPEPLRCTQPQSRSRRTYAFEADMAICQRLASFSLCHSVGTDNRCANPPWCEGSVFFSFSQLTDGGHFDIARHAPKPLQGKDLVGGWAPCNGSLQRIHSNSEAAIRLESARTEDLGHVET